MPRFAARTFALLATLAATAAGAEPLPRPAALEPNIRFWLRVYTEVDTGGGLIHDNERLDVVYETVRFAPGLSARSRERQVESAKRRYASLLRQLATGQRSGLSAEAERVLGLWPEGTSNRTLRAAAGNVRFQLGQADKFRAGLVRAGQWRTHIEQVLADEGVPPELVALPHVESSYNPRAYSRVGAAGLWQFTRSTGIRYLRIDDVVDERMDPHKATVAAARLLRHNYRDVGAWPLAITAYNHGVAGMARAVRTLGTRDIATIVARHRSRSFGFASRNFYSEFLAASEIDHEPERFFGPLEALPALEYETFPLDHFYTITSLQRALGIDLEALREHNLSLRPAVWNGAKYVPRGFELRVPSLRLTQPLAQVIAAIPPGERLERQHRDRFYKIRRGDSLSRIAARYGLSDRELAELNNLRSRHSIRVGQILRLPDRASGPEPVAVAARAEPAPLPSDRVHVVRRGETIHSIARRYGLSEAELVAANRLRNRNTIVRGQRLRLPGAAAPVVVAARAESTPPAPVAEQPAAASAAAASAAAEATGGAPELASAGAVVSDAALAPAEPAGAPPLEVAAIEPAAAPTPSAPPTAEPAAAGTAPEPAVVESAAIEPAVEPAVIESAAVEPAVIEPAADASAAPTPDAAAPPSPDPSNYAVSSGNRIIVQAGETLGHYAEWLEVRAGALRRLNRLAPGAPVRIGRTAKLDFSRVTPEVFEERRLRYHLALQEAFFEAYVVTGTETHVLKRGETLWYLANKKLRVPEWLLRQYNPDLDFGALRAGTSLIVPIIEPREA